MHFNIPTPHGMGLPACRGIYPIGFAMVMCSTPKSVEAMEVCSDLDGPVVSFRRWNPYRIPTHPRLLHETRPCLVRPQPFLHLLRVRRLGAPLLPEASTTESESELDSISSEDRCGAEPKLHPSVPKTGGFRAGVSADPERVPDRELGTETRNRNEQCDRTTERRRRRTSAGYRV